MAGSEWASVAFGLASAASWGAGDFSGGLATKRTSVYGVIIASQVVGVILFVGLAFISREAVPTPDNLLWGALAGMVGAIGLTALYRGLAMGQMGVVAPISAVIAAAVPILVGAFVEGLPGILQMIGFGSALVGVWFLSRPKVGAVRTGQLISPLVAGVGFGLFFVLIDRVSEVAVFWPLVAARAASLTLLLVIARAARQPLIPERRYWPLTTLAGVLDAGGNAFFALAAQTGRLDVAAVLSSLYPASTVVLAWLILKERFARPQTVGIAATLAAIVLITI
jgi:drug/metabolite transporter (DMT)-like permease